MKKRKMRASAGTLALFAIAVLLLGFSTVTGARAALGVYSDTYLSTLEMRHVGVALVENGDEVSHRDYVAGTTWSVNDENGLLGRFKDEKFILGNEYDEVLSVRNTSNSDGTAGISEYVRVTVRKYWVDKEGNKTTELSPDLIELAFAEGGWVVDSGASTEERTVLYYTRLLDAGEETAPFMEKIKVDAAVPLKATQKEEGGVVTTTYDYDGYSFVLEAEADGIQEHHAEDAILSAWGREVEINGATLSLK